MQKFLFSILITTKNRIEGLQFTLQKINNLLKREDVECIVFDDGSTDKTSEFVLKNYPKIKLYRNEKSKGFYNRELMLASISGQLAYRVRAVLSENRVTLWSPLMDASKAATAESAGSKPISTRPNNSSTKR